MANKSTVLKRFQEVFPFFAEGLVPMKLSTLYSLVITTALIGCGVETESSHSHSHPETPETTPTESSSLEIIGRWASSWGTDEITDTHWNNQTIDSFDNEANHLVAQNSEADEYNPSKFSLIVWTEMNANEFYYCTVAYGLETAAEAEASEDTANRDDLTEAGCGGFPWTKLTPAIEIHGEWTTEWGTESITSHTWNGATVVSFDNETNTALTHRYTK